MAILTSSGRSAIAAAIKNDTLYLGWGNGLEAWDTVPDPPAVDDDALEAEVGRRLVEIKAYVVSDQAGEIQFPNNDRYTVSASPTGKLYIKVVFDFADASDQVIRELALFQGTVPASGHESDKYLDVGNVDDEGILMTLDRIPKITRSVYDRAIFEMVLNI